MRLIKLTDVGDEAIYAVDTWIEMLRPPHVGEYEGHEVGCVVCLSGWNVAVKEPIEFVANLLRGQDSE